MSRFNHLNRNRVQVEWLEDRTNPSALGLSHLPEVAQVRLDQIADQVPSQAIEAAPVFNISAEAAATVTSSRLPDAAQQGLATADEHNAEQADTHAGPFGGSGGQGNE